MIENNITMSFEFVFPKENHDVKELATLVHDQFVGNPDYIDTGILIHINEDENKTHVMLFSEDIKDKTRTKQDILRAFQKMLDQI